MLTIPKSQRRYTCYSLLQDFTRLKMLDSLKLHLLKLMLFARLNRTYNKSFNQSSNLKHKNKDYLGTNSKPNLLISIILGFIQNITTFINNIRITLLLLELLCLTKFYLRPLSLRSNQLPLTIVQKKVKKRELSLDYSKQV